MLNGRVTIEILDQDIDGKIIGRLISLINYVESKYKRINIPIVIRFGNIRFRDKLTYIILECIAYYLIVEKKHDVIICYNPTIGIDIEGILSSPLKLLRSPKREIRMDFSRKFKQDIQLKHFRKVVPQKDVGILDEINYFLEIFNIDKESREDISEVFAELISNGTEHGDGECLVDIDVTDDYHKVGENDISKQYYGINIVVLNFSEKLLGSQIRKKILDSDLMTERYKQVKEAYFFHKSFFSDEYCDEDFFNLTTFQDRISGRLDDELTGGTGLTLLIRSLEQKSDTNLCYVLSGSRALGFKQEYLEYNSEKWLGFNEENDFLTTAPNYELLMSGCDIFFPGTAYNLHFIMEKYV